MYGPGNGRVASSGIGDPDYHLNAASRWTFLGDEVGSEDEDDLFLGVHGFAWFDKTGDEPSASFPAGELPFEAIIVRCTEAIKDVDVEVRLPGDDWALVGEVAATPILDEELFPPTF